MKTNENIVISWDNYENHEKLRIPFEKKQKIWKSKNATRTLQKNLANLKFPFEIYENHET